MKSKNSPVVESDNLFKENTELIHCLWLLSKNVRDIGSTRDWLDAISLILPLLPSDKMSDTNGDLFNIPEADKAFGDDIHMRWLRYWLECDGTNLAPRMNTAQYDRLRLISLFFRLRYPKTKSLIESFYPKGDRL